MMYANSVYFGHILAQFRAMRAEVREVRTVREGGADPTMRPIHSEVERDGPGAVPVIPVHAHHQPSVIQSALRSLKLQPDACLRTIRNVDDDGTEVKTVVDRPGPAGTPDEDGFVSVTRKTQRKRKSKATIGTRENNEPSHWGTALVCFLI